MPGRFFQLADPGDRLTARVIDVSAPALPAILLVPIGIVAGSPNVIRGGFVCAFLAALGLMFLNLFWLHRYGQTLGKRLLGIRIVRTAGERVGLGRILGLRTVPVWILEAIPLVGWLFSAADALFIFTRDRRCLHDRFADTVVVDLRGARRARGLGPLAPSAESSTIPAAQAVRGAEASRGRGARNLRARTELASFGVAFVLGCGPNCGASGVGEHPHKLTLPMDHTVG